MKIVVLTHGEMSTGIRSSLNMIYGEDDRILFIPAYTETYKLTLDVVNSLKDILERYEEVVVFTDLLGGSVNNEALKLFTNHKFHLISNVNLGVILEFVAKTKYADDYDLESLIKEILSNELIKPIYCNDLLKEESLYD